ncbi:MAG: trehalose operon repressor [Solobacterium sp.]|nr:trehalose operon repressor [Solobacterium sp.]
MSKYQDIYNQIRGDIERGEYKAGSTLPGEFFLMEQYNVSRDTVRKALGLLAANGYIQKSRGVGSIVLDINRIEFPVSGLVSFKELAPVLGDHVETRVIAFEKMHPDERIKKELELNDEDWVWLIQRVRKVDGEAVILDTDFLNAQIAPGLTEEQAKDSLFAYLEGDLGLKIAYAEKEITCQAATNMDRRWLDLKDNNMVVSVVSHTYLEDTRVFQYTSSRHRPDKFRFKDFARRIQKA